MDDPNESSSAGFEPDDDLLESLPIDETGGSGPDEPPDPSQPDDGGPKNRGAKAPLSAPKSHSQPSRKKGVSEQPAYGFWLIVVALTLVAAVYIVTVFHYDTAKDVVTVMGVFTGIVGALVGAYFGVRGATYASLVAQERNDGAGRQDDHERHDGHERHGDHERQDDHERHGEQHRDRHAGGQGR